MQTAYPSTPEEILQRKPYNGVSSKMAQLSKPYSLTGTERVVCQALVAVDSVDGSSMRARFEELGLKQKNNVNLNQSSWLCWDLKQLGF